MSNQKFLQSAILTVLSDSTVLSIADMNREVFSQFSDELTTREIEWVWQHLIATARKTLSDNGEITYAKNNGTNVYTLA